MWAFMISHYTIAFQYLHFLSLLIIYIIISQSHSVSNSYDYLTSCEFLFIALIDNVYAINYFASTSNN